MVARNPAACSNGNQNSSLTPIPPVSAAYRARPGAGTNGEQQQLLTRLPALRTQQLQEMGTALCQHHLKAIRAELKAKPPPNYLPDLITAGTAPLNPSVTGSTLLPVAFPQTRPFVPPRCADAPTPRKPKAPRRAPDPDRSRDGSRSGSRRSPHIPPPTGLRRIPQVGSGAAPRRNSAVPQRGIPGAKRGPSRARLCLGSRLPARSGPPRSHRRTDLRAAQRSAPLRRRGRARPRPPRGRTEQPSLSVPLRWRRREREKEGGRETGRGEEGGMEGGRPRSAPGKGRFPLRQPHPSRPLREPRLKD